MKPIQVQHKNGMVIKVKEDTYEELGRRKENWRQSFDDVIRKLLKLPQYTKPWIIEDTDIETQLRVLPLNKDPFKEKRVDE